MKMKKMMAILLAGLITANSFVICVPDLGQDVYAACNFYSTLAQDYMKSEVVTETVDGVLWSFCLNTPTRSNGTANITDLKIAEIKGDVTDISVPSTINGVSVIEIGVNAFISVQRKVTSVTIPDSVTRICDNAFNGCSLLQSVTFDNPDSIVVLGESAFNGCSSLKSIVLGKELMKSNTTGDYAFRNCIALESVVINNREDIIVPKSTFEGCKSLNTVIVAADAVSFQAEKNSFKNCGISELVLPTAKLGESAFEGNVKLKSITFTQNCEIGINAFKGCFGKETGVSKTVYFNGEIVKLGESAFNDCAGLTGMKFSVSNTMVSFSKECIAGTDSLTKLEFLGKDVSLSDQSFCGSCVETLKFSNIGVSALYGDLFGTENNTLKNAEFSSSNVNFYQSDSTGKNVFGHAKKMERLMFYKNVSKVGGTIAAKGYYKGMYFFNPYVVIGLADNSGQAYTVYGYDMSNEVSNNSYYGVRKFAEKQENVTYEHIQEELNVQYVGAADLYLGQDIATTYIKVSQNYADGSKEETVTYAADGNKYSGFVISHDKFVVGTNTITVTYGDKKTSFTVNVLPLEVKSFKVTYVGGEKKEHETLLKKDFLVTDVEYNNGTVVGSVEDFTISDYGVSLTPGTHVIKITYGNHVEECEVVVTGKVLTTLNISLSESGKIKKYVGDRLTQSDFIVTAVYNNGEEVNNFTDYELSNNVITSDTNRIVFKCGEYETSFECKALTVSYIRAYYDGTVIEGENIDTTKLKVTAVYSDGSEREVSGYTLSDYKFAGDGSGGSIIITYEGKSVTVNLTSDLKPTVDPTQGVLPTTKPTATPKPTDVLKPTVTSKPIPTDGYTNSVVPTIKPKPTTVQKATATPKPTTMPKVKKMTLKCSLKGVSLNRKSAKTTYNHYSKKTIKFTPIYKGGKVEYQIVKKGKKASNSKWRKVSSRVSVSKEMRACVYFRYKINGKYAVVKSGGFILDKTAPMVDVDASTYKLKVYDSLSGVSSIKVNGKKVKNGYVLQSGSNKIVAIDKAGNKKVVKCKIVY